MAKSLEAKQEEMRNRQKLRKQSKPLTKAELIELLTKRVRNEKTNSQAFVSMSRLLAELKGYVSRPNGAVSKPRNPVEVIEDLKPVDEGDIYEQVLAEEARRKQANV